jgi:hypothetical protein
MDLIVELKITNISDWAAIQPLLHRLKIPFVQRTSLREVAQIPDAIDADAAALLALQRESPAFVWSPYGSDDAEKRFCNFSKIIKIK